MRAALAIAVLTTTAGCIPAPSPAVDCYTAIDRHWPADSIAWARRTMFRESRNNPSAQNRRSTAAGCFGMTKRHGWRFRSGWTAGRYDPDENVMAAVWLYTEQGAAPWA